MLRAPPITIVIAARRAEHLRFDRRDRDPQLVPTIQDCLAKARYPEAAPVRDSWQHGPKRRPFRSIRIALPDPRRGLASESRACWGVRRSCVSRGEDFFLQLDSHHRFRSGLGRQLLRHAESSGPKPILTTYATPFRPGTPDVLEAGAMRMDFDRFTEEAIVLFRPSEIPNWQSRTRPVRGRFLSAHFFFTIGDFVKEVPYDPDLLLRREEISLTVRASRTARSLSIRPRSSSGTQ